MMFTARANKKAAFILRANQGACSLDIVHARQYCGIHRYALQKQEKQDRKDEGQVCAVIVMIYHNSDMIHDNVRHW